MKFALFYEIPGALPRSEDSDHHAFATVERLFLVAFSHGSKIPEFG